MSEHDLWELRAQLVALRADTLLDLAAGDVLDAGSIALADHVHAIAAIDADLADGGAPQYRPGRGGDPRAAARAARDNAIRELDALLDGTYYYRSTSGPAKLFASLGAIARLPTMREAVSLSVECFTRSPKPGSQCQGKDRRSV